MRHGSRQLRRPDRRGDEPAERPDCRPGHGCCSPDIAGRSPKSLANRVSSFVLNRMAGAFDSRSRGAIRSNWRSSAVKSLLIRRRKEQFDFGYWEGRSPGRDSPSTVLVRPDRDLPPFPVMPVCLERNEPAALFQNFGRFERALPVIPEGAWGRGDKYRARKWWAWFQSCCSQSSSLNASGGVGKGVGGGVGSCGGRPSFNLSNMSLAAIVAVLFLRRNCCKHPPRRGGDVGVDALKGSTSNASGLIDLSKCRT